jgi:surface antigen
MTKVLIAGAAALMLAACTTDGMPIKQTAGALGGGAAGGVLGSQFGKGNGQLLATAGGTLLGAFLGSELGKSLDRADTLAVSQATNQAYAAPLGQTISWNTPESGNSGTITPVREGRTPTGSYCREFQQTITVGGRKEQATGQACRQTDGSWKIVS